MLVPEIMRYIEENEKSDELVFTIDASSKREFANLRVAFNGLNEMPLTNKSMNAIN